MSIVFPIIHYFLDAIWQGATSLDYLKSFDRWLKNVLSRSEKIARYSYPLYFIIAISTIWSTWNKQEELILKTNQKFPDLLFIGNTPLIAIIIVGVTTLLMFYFSDKIYKWDVRLMYGGIFGKLEETIAEMEKLKQG